jgi:hypothetical protein
VNESGSEITAIVPLQLHNTGQAAFLGVKQGFEYEVGVQGKRDRVAGQKDKYTMDDRGVRSDGHCSTLTMSTSTDRNPERGYPI